jgi:methionyl-tRNA formyltransferase
MNIIIAGKNNIAVDFLKYVLELKNLNVFVILNKTDNFKNSFQKSLGFYARLWNVSIINLENSYVIENAIFISLEFDKLIKPSLFKTNAVFNIHFSKLPAYKGQYTSSWPILNNEIESGVTLHKIDNGIDSGSIVDQYSFPINKNETARSLYLKYIEYGTKLIIKNLQNLILNNYECNSQSHINSSFYGIKSINYSNLILDYNKTAFQISLQLRAFSFLEYQLPKYNNYEIHNFKILDSKSYLKSGKLISENSKSFMISTIDYDMILFKSLYNDLWRFCRENNLNELNKLLKTEIKIETKTREGWNALIIAAFNGSYDCVKLLLKFGANPNAVNTNGTTVLMYAKENAIKNNDTKLLDLLLKNGARLEDKDIYGKTVLCWLIDENEYLYNYLIQND